MTKFFFIEGNISSGKSTFVSLLDKKFPSCKVVYEPLDVWKNLKDKDGKNILDHFYSDMKKYGYAFQSTAFLSRVIRLTEAAKVQDVDYIFIERSVYSDKNIFAKNCKETGVMTDIEHTLYCRWFGWMEQFFDIPQKYFIYLRSDPDTSYKRIKERNREEESGVELDYLKTIHRLHEDWLTGRDDVLTLDANTPFRDDEKTLDTLIKQIKDHIKEIDEQEEKEKIEIYTDGSCLKNPGAGGWGAIIKCGDMEEEISGSEKNTTNNVMELKAGIEAIKAVKKLDKFKEKNDKLNITMYTDSMYVSKGITQWVKNWKKNGWKTANKGVVKHRDLWENLDTLCDSHNIEWKWVKAHDGNEMNERADKLARNCAEKI